MPVDGPYPVARWLHIDRGETANHFLACPFGVISGPLRVRVS